MVLESAVHRFNLCFDLSWKVMKDILTECMGILDFATGSPRETLQTAYANGIINNDVWLRMLRVRNKLAHDYDGVIAMDEFYEIVGRFFEMFAEFRQSAEKYYQEETDVMDSFDLGDRQE